MLLAKAGMFTGRPDGAVHQGEAASGESGGEGTCGGSEGAGAASSAPAALARPRVTSAIKSASRTMTALRRPWFRNRYVRELTRQAISGSIGQDTPQRLPGRKADCGVDVRKFVNCHHRGSMGVRKKSLDSVTLPS